MENWNSKNYLKNYYFDFCAIKKWKNGVNKIDKNSIEKIENWKVEKIKIERESI
jgi:hypothetical protein